MKIGKFYIDDLFVEDFENFSEVLSKMKFVPVRVEHLFYKKQFEYVGYSDLFTTVPFGFSIPEYKLEFTSDMNDKISVSVNKVT